MWRHLLAATLVNVTKQQFCISCLKKKKAIWPIIQQPVTAGSRRIGVKAAKPGVQTTLM